MAMVGKIFDDNPAPIGKGEEAPLKPEVVQTQEPEVQEPTVQEVDPPVEETTHTGKNTKGGKK